MGCIIVENDLHLPVFRIEPNQVQTQIGMMKPVHIADREAFYQAEEYSHSPAMHAYQYILFLRPGQDQVKDFFLP